MIYVTDNFSIQMFEKQEYNISTRKIKKNKFLEKTKNAITSIGSWRIAKQLHKPCGKKDITLKKGDTIYIITSKFGRNKSDYKKEKYYRYEEFKIN